MKKNRNIKEKRAAFSDSLPNVNANPAIHSSTQPNANNDGDKGWVLPLQRTMGKPRTTSAKPTKISEDRLLKIRRRSMKINQAEMNGIRRIWEASSLPNE